MLASTSSAAAATTTITTRTNTHARCARRRNFSFDVQHHQRERNTNNSEFRRQRQRKRRNNGDNALFVTHADANFGGDTITNNGLTREISEDVDTVLLDYEGHMARRPVSSRGEKSRGLFTRNAAKASVFCHEQRDENERVLPVEVFRARDGGGREPHIYRGVCVGVVFIRHRV